MTHVATAGARRLGELRLLGGAGLDGAGLDGDGPKCALASCPTMTLAVGVRHFQPDFATRWLLAVEDGFVVVRASEPPPSRPVVTAEAGPGELLLPPGPDEVLVALTTARLRLVSFDARSQLLGAPGVAEQLLEALTDALRWKQEAAASLGPTRHRERVEKRLLQLAARYGHVVRDGVRIDFPVSHALLAEMIASSRETVTRALDELQRSGFVAREGSSYRVRVPPDDVE